MIIKNFNHSKREIKKKDRVNFPTEGKKKSGNILLQWRGKVGRPE